jgi:hypothetical protein
MSLKTITANLALILAITSVSSASAEVDFNRDIRPIFTAKCTECHGGVKAAAGVSFVYREQVIGYESDSGRAVVKPLSPSGSELYLRITTDDLDDRMPPADEHEPLSKEEINTIREWIESGAEWSGHWAFEPPVMPEIPTSSWEEKANNNIDRFIHARLEHESLSPTGPAQAGRLFRRMNLALTGLPPSIEALENFEQAHQVNAKKAISKAVEDLLNHPAFGERWASMWLDLVRYADSRGLGSDARRNIWPYRDWVIKAFNEDLPFDTFTVMQLAGDLLPEPTLDDLIATACHRNTQTNDEGGTDDEEFRIGAVMDRVSSTWQIWGATTFNCVQCHDHPYDTFRHEEYYSFMDFFNNTADSDLPDEGPLLRTPLENAQSHQARELDDKILRLQKELWKNGDTLKQKSTWASVSGITVKSNNGTKYVVDTDEGKDVFHTEGTVQTQTAVIIDIPQNSKTQLIQALRLNFLPLNPETAIHSPEWGFVISDLKAKIVNKKGEATEVEWVRSVADVPWMPNAPFKPIGNNGVGFGADSRIHHERNLVLVPTSPISIPDGAKLTISISCNKTGHGHPMAIKRGHVAISTDENWTQWVNPSPKIQETDTRLTQLRNQRKKIKSINIPVMMERPSNITRPTHVFMRGNFLNKGNQVKAELPASLALDTQSGNKNRLDMAHWWVSKDHPLTARVFVNRIWEQLFGTGIVPTLEDFGSAGERPTHPELLDYLALRFQNEHDWSIKSIIKEIVLSATYQQSAVISSEALENDPSNRLLTRGPRGRLSAEIVRDQALAISGLLSEKMGGPPVRPPIPEGVWQPFDAGDKWNTADKNDPNRYRRSIYTYMKRSIPYPTFASFDAPSREFCTPRRLVSNTPIQALVTLNDTTFYECAEAYGSKIRSNYPGTLSEKLNRAFKEVTGSEPDQERLEELANLFKTLNSQASESNPVNAWLMIAQVLLNLDEALNY